LRGFWQQWRLHRGTHKEPKSIAKPRSLTVADAPHADTHHDSDIWKHMSPAHQQELKAEDSDAWWHVVGLLLLIISVGVVLAIGTALLSGVLH
jgi:hypothetical protein